MSINFPTTLDTFPNPSSGDLLENATQALDHDQQHANANDAIEALEAKVGVNSSAVNTSHDYKLSGVATGDKAVSKTGVETLTNKTLTSPAINLGSNATGDIYYRDSGGTFQRLPIGTVNQILGVSAGGIPQWTSNPNATGPNYFTATAEEDITTGQPVGISNYPLGNKYVARAKRTNLGLTLGYTSSSSAQWQSYSCPIGGDKFIILGTQTSDDSLYATVVSVNNSTKTMSFGTAVAVTADITASDQFFACCKLDTDKFIVFYIEDASTTIIKYRVGTVSGTTITFGSAGTFATGGTTVSSICCDQISTDKGVMFYSASTVTDDRLIGFTVSGTTATAGTPKAIGTTIDDNALTPVLKKIGTDKFIFVCCTGGATSNLVQVGTMSGTTITLGTETAYSTTDNVANTNYPLKVISPATDVVVILYTTSGNSSEMVAGTISGTTPTFGTPNSAGVGNNGTCLYAESPSSILVSSNNSNASTYKYTLSGTTLTSVGIVAQPSVQTTDQQHMLAMDNGYFVTIGVNSASTTFTYGIQGMSNNFIGIAQATVSRGGTLTVITRGVDANQSGLIAGGKYLVSAGALSFVSAIVTVNSLDDIDVVRAISATEVII